MDLNPRSPEFLAKDVRFLQQDCTIRWDIPEASLDVVFTSNFFEHLPDKLALRNTFQEAHRCLRPGGKLIAMGPNIKHVPGSYWDYWDHFLCLTDLSLGEGLENNGYRVVESRSRFLPYSMVNAPKYPVALIRLYLALPILWRFFGKQFLVIAERI
jgi:SAM-dependent methyltransferase